MKVEMYPKFSDFLRVQDGEIASPDSNSRFLRGIGLGSWLLPEGYMWGIFGGRTAPHELEETIIELCGEEYAADFWQRYRDAWITESDFERMAEQGYDHVRLPINSRPMFNECGELTEDSFFYIDRTIEWAGKYGMWVVLDLHGAPGGQTGTNIDDSPNGVPELYTNAEYWNRTLDLWRALAVRYKDSTVVAAYDLLNEPLPNEWADRYPTELLELYRELTQTIRDIDQDHIIMYEGVRWATDFSFLDEVLDPNSVLQFHRYWCAPDETMIADFVQLREKFELPIYMGEGGENNPSWIFTAHSLYEDFDIPWNFWPWKKVETVTSPLSITAPADWQIFIDYAQKGLGHPEAEQTRALLDEFLANMQIERCTTRPDIDAAIFRHRAGNIPVWAYGFGGKGASYQSDGRAEVAFREHDTVTIRRIDPQHDAQWDLDEGQPYAGAPFFEIALEAGDWLKYDVSGISTIDVDCDGEIAAIIEPSSLVLQARTAVVLRGISAS